MSPPLYSVRTLPRLLSAEIPGARVCRNFWKGKEQTCYLQNHLAIKKKKKYHVHIIDAELKIVRHEQTFIKCTSFSFIYRL